MAASHWLLSLGQIRWFGLAAGNSMP